MKWDEYRRRVGRLKTTELLSLTSGSKVPIYREAKRAGITPRKDRRRARWFPVAKDLRQKSGSDGTKRIKRCGDVS